MLLKELGRTGVQVPEVGLGTWNLQNPAALRCGLDAGALFLDTAESYGSEEAVGEVIKGQRGRVFVATKVSPENFRAADFRSAVDGSLSKLGIERIDLVQLHRPNPAIPLEETMGAMREALEAGKVRFAGVSNFSVEQLEEAQKALGKYRIVSNQVRYNLIDRTIEQGLLRHCEKTGITVIAYSPLAKGLDRILDCDPSGVLAEIARATGKSPAQVALNWCLAKPPVVVIPAANSDRHVLDNCGASGWRLSPEQVALLDMKIQFRRRNRLDALVRKYMPKPLERVAIRVRDSLPKGLRRKLT